MDSYIIRIYRRSKDKGEELAGLVERVGSGKRRAFRCCSDLWAFLSDSPTVARRPRKSGVSKA